MVDVAIIGHGVVGSGVAEIILNHKDLLTEKAKNEINLKYILDIRDFENVPYADKFTKDFNDILNDDDVRVVIETAGGATFAYDYVKACLLKGKSVVTSNKELVAAKGAELLKIAMDNNINFLFEASVGGGIPVLRPIAQCLAANDLTEITGILNGTTNFILTKMIKDNMQFSDALSMAQRLGYAERDPSADIDGHDAARKICILASLAFGKHVYPDQIKTDGIRGMLLSDIALNSNMGYVTKLVGNAKVLGNGKITAAVSPAVIKKSDIISSTEDVFNIIKVRGDAIGDVAFYGRGAGKLPTASAVVADVLDCVKHLHARKYLFWDEGDKDYVVNPDTVAFSYLVITDAKNSDAVKSEFAVSDVCEENGNVAFTLKKTAKCDLKAKMEKLGINDYRIFRVID
ncbi:MAG: homoserine dehydrogenase [Clostridia bacterium]|nr:homoserine dehydrogenase [Clostridia bacterium]MEE1278077.1 homoserine dehydrogenase [Acutalibacteraceae bacterium]